MQNGETIVTTYYTQRHPEKSVLHKVITKNMNTVFLKMEEKGRYLPKYVRKEFESFIDCGIFAKGSLRLSCESCHRDKLVAFSCKRRGLCPSCGGRRMSDAAAHLVDNVFPIVPVRQWVLSFPYNLRYLFSYNKKALTKALEVVMRVINRFYINRGKLRGDTKNRTGSVTLIQRFGGSLNLNVHFHILSIDGVFDEEGMFKDALAPSNDEIVSLVNKIKQRVFRAMERGGWIDHYQVNEEDELGLEYPGLAESYSSSILRKNNQGKRVECLGKRGESRWVPFAGDLCSYVYGFSLHAKVRINAIDRKGLEHLCRYVARPAIANHRLKMDEEGRVVYQLKKAYQNGTTHLRFTQEEFVEKLIALVPTPRMNLIRYHGVLGANSKLRKKVVKKNKNKEKLAEKSPKVYRLSWSKLLKRVFDFEIEACVCGGKLRILSAIIDIETTTKIMNSLQMEIYQPMVSPARAPPRFELSF
tara:strand:+ start:140 stop:1555 length:1416 start_codon:yes stop_codon:yes gene_type:complete